MVTGGSRGIGAAIVRRLARHGAEVAFRYASPAAEADTVSRSRNWADGRCLSKQIAPRCPNCERPSTLLQQPSAAWTFCE
jgi:NAD(P)-dependent dehydrogenase (short-subunit alcohol dehydrogenase family)